ncbi:uncharacterized protein LOC134812179 [Bolinopsis microptera]|uniref:uncharacterized protein LOC134812179 n=1 Tax=Bolinopsis microptera TaxID=2820187 RepID=UPI00307A2C28
MYRATKDKCGEFFVNLVDNTFTITTTDNSGVTYASDPLDTISLHQDLDLDWKLAQTMKDNETMKFVFSDKGSKYAGFGNIDGTFFETKPTGESKQQFTLWTSEDNPTYLPIYLASNDADKSLCMFAEAQGAPIEITLTETETEWLIYRVDEVKFYFYYGDSVHDALNQCTEKWKAIYPASDASWTNDFIVGSLTTDKIKTDQDSGNSIATHYILSPDVISMKKGNLGYELEIENEDNLAASTNIILPLKTRQTITSGSGITLTPEEGYYPTDGDDTYILDFDNSEIQSDFDSYLSDTDAGFLLQGGFLLSPTSEDCSKYFHCSDQQFEDDTSVCLSADFGDSKVFKEHNFYDVSKRKALQPQNVAKNLVLETIASPGTTHYHRTNLDLTEAGLKTCYHNILNLHQLGIRAVTCNMCGGVLPSTADQKSICFRWGLLALLMPYVIISSEVEDLTGALSNSGDDVFMKMKESVVLRKQLHYYLDKTYETSKPFITEKSNGVVIGENLFMVVNLEGSPKVTVEFPEGEWLAPDPTLQTEGTHFNIENDSPEPELTYEEDVTKLIFYKLDNIFVLQDKDDENKVEVHIFQYNEGYYSSDITSTFTYNEHKTDIKMEPNNEQVTFTYTAASSTIDKDKFKVSKLVIFYWDNDAGNESPKITYPVGSNKFNVVFNYSEGNNVVLKSIFENWSESLKEGSNS